ncbi:unnamed protein product [Rotaria sp. Silwood2]|nr:unnamed protein product [Rotaria sp. Silwood2]
MFYLVFTIPKESIHIMEDLPIGTSIYTFSTDGCKTINNAGTYRFVDSQKNSNDFFLIDPYTGRITTKKLIDRDDFCLRRMCSCSKCEIILEVLCVNMGKIFFNDLSIIIDDRNDHSPQFSKSSIIIDILENVPIGYLIPIDIAIDLDYGNNSIQGYTLLEDNSTNKILNAFQIEYTKKNDLLALRLIKILDRELYHSLEYIIQAYDGGQPQALISRLNIYINILDVNDMSPIFDRSEINVLLSESTSIGTFIARVHAFDGDAGLNGLIYYTIVSLDPPSNGTFILSKETGEIHLGKSLDYEKEKSYRIKIKAQDNGPQQVSIPAFAMIYIDIKDENDNYPLITPTFNDDRNSGVEHILNSSIITIRENLLNGTFLGHISISDLDSDNNGLVSWSLESNGSISIKELFNNEAFLMFTARIFDREEQSQYDIRLKAHDHGIQSLTSILNFTLIILDENDNAPIFDKEFYSINITETISIDTIILHFHATDADEENTLNSKIEYQLSNETIFSLNSSTGELRLIGKLDREEQSSYEFDIIASDHGQPQPLSSTVRCIINLIDINDNYPIFDLSEYVFEIPETWSNLSPIGHVHATDADENYGELTYKLVYNDMTMTNEWPFELTTNGTLYLKGASVDIDYERCSIYQFLILAIDNDDLNTSVPVTIHILNRNDFCPELINNSTALFFNIDLCPDEKKFSNFDLKPSFAILNSTSKIKFLCTKYKDDNIDFDISLVPAISSDNLKIYKNHLNNTAMKIIIESSGYIGTFQLICSPINNKTVGVRSDIIIGISPGLLTRIGRCIVYENKYIECNIRAPKIVSAIDNHYQYDFNFIEIHQSSKENAYNQLPELVKIDKINNTLTFRWFPMNDGVFPEGLQMLIRETSQYFDSTDYLMGMTPSFLIKANFTVQVLSSTNFQIHFDHSTFSSPLMCHGNISRDNNSTSLNQEENSRTFDETYQTTISITNLTPNTWYQLCFQCRRNASVKTISETLCIREQTKKSSSILF